jgi:hypothetical protein
VFTSARHTTRAEQPRHVRRARNRLRLLAASVATLVATLASVLAVGTPAGAAPTAGTKGDPQPELAQFKIGTNSGSGTGTVLADGTLVLAFISSSGNKTTVCVLHPGDRKCASTATLSPEKGDSFTGVPEVLSTGGKDVSVVIYDCCNSTPDNAFVYNSTNDGKSFSKYVKAGTISSIGAGTAAGGDLVVATFTTGSINVQAFPPHPASPVTAFATPNGQEDGNTSLTTYRGGVLVANDNLTNTYVEYAKSGSDLNASSSYKAVATVKNETTVTISGNALLTDPSASLTGGDRLRFFSGTSFGKSYKVPDSKAGDDGYFVMQQAGGTVHVFFEGRRDDYDVFSATTRDGSHWSPLSQYGTAIDSTDLAPALAPSGAGVVLEAGSGTEPVFVQPILNPQRVHIKLAKTKVKKGQSTKLSGTVAPHLKGQLVTLERKAGKLWDTVKTTHESASGTFSFTVPGKTETYRTVVAYQPGYYLYGYSNSVTLTAV